MNTTRTESRKPNAVSSRPTVTVLPVPLREEVREESQMPRILALLLLVALLGALSLLSR